MGKIITVNFRGADLYGFEADDGVFVALKPIVDAIGLDWSAQLKRVKRDPLFSEGMAIMAIPFGRGGEQECVCLRIDLVNGWLFTIDATRIKDDSVSERVMVYRRECASVLYQHFQHDKGVSAVEQEPHQAEIGRVRMVTECRQTFGTRASAELWFRLGLPVVPSMLDDKRQLDLLEYGRIKAAG